MRRGGGVGEFVLKSTYYGSYLSKVVEAGWRSMMYGTMCEYGAANTTVERTLAELRMAIADYDEAWASYATLKLWGTGKAPMPSLYHGYYFNLPAAPPSSSSLSVFDFSDRWAVPEPGLHAAVDRFRNASECVKGRKAELRPDWPANATVLRPDGNASLSTR